MCDDCSRAVLFVESLNQESLILVAILDRSHQLLEDVHCGIHKNFIQLFLLPDLVEKGIETFDPCEFASHAVEVSKVEQGLKITKGHR